MKSVVPTQVVGTFFKTGSIQSMYPNLVINDRSFSMVKRLGEGGQAFVFVVREEESIEMNSSDRSNQFVLKVTCPTSKELLKLAISEGEYMKSFRHSNIVKYEVHSVEENTTNAFNFAKWLNATTGMQGNRLSGLGGVTRSPLNVNSVFSSSSTTNFDPRNKTLVFLVMEYCPEGHLLQYVNDRASKQKELSEKEILELFLDTCKAIEYLHQRSPQIAHRDIKLENLLVCENGTTVKLCDFGSCSTERIVCDNKFDRTRIEEQVEKFTTPNYRAPELVDLFSKLVISEQVDIWAIGCVLYAMCYRQHAFEDGSNLAILNVNYKIPDRPSYSESLLKMFPWLFNRDPECRPRIGDVTDYVNQILGNVVHVSAAIRGTGKGENPYNNIPHTEKGTDEKPREEKSSQDVSLSRTPESIIRRPGEISLNQVNLGNNNNNQSRRSKALESRLRGNKAAPSLKKFSEQDSDSAPYLLQFDSPNDVSSQLDTFSSQSSQNFSWNPFSQEEPSSDFRRSFSGNDSQNQYHHHSNTFQISGVSQNDLIELQMDGNTSPNSQVSGTQFVDFDPFSSQQSNPFYPSYEDHVSDINTSSGSRNADSNNNNSKCNKNLYANNQQQAANNFSMRPASQPFLATNAQSNSHGQSVSSEQMQNKYGYVSSEERYEPSRPSLNPFFFSNPGLTSTSYSGFPFDEQVGTSVDSNGFSTVKQHQDVLNSSSNGSSKVMRTSSSSGKANTYPNLIDSQQHASRASKSPTSSLAYLPPSQQPQFFSNPSFSATGR